MAFTEDNSGAKQPEFGAQRAEPGKRWRRGGGYGERNGMEAETIGGSDPARGVHRGSHPWPRLSEIAGHIPAKQDTARRGKGQMSD